MKSINCTQLSKHHIQPSWKGSDNPINGNYSQRKNAPSSKWFVQIKSCFCLLPLADLKAAYCRFSASIMSKEGLKIKTWLGGDKWCLLQRPSIHIKKMWLQCKIIHLYLRDEYGRMFSLETEGQQWTKQNKMWIHLKNSLFFKRIHTKDIIFPSCVAALMKDNLRPTRSFFQKGSNSN